MQEIITIAVVLLAVFLAVRSIVKGLMPMRKSSCGCGGCSTKNITDGDKGRCCPSPFEQDRRRTVYKGIK
jgi:hypothetical protein